MRKSLERDAAIAAGLPRYFTGRPCRHGHIAERQTVNHTCVECGSRISAKAHAKFRSVRLVKQREYKARRTPEQLQADIDAKARWYWANRRLTMLRARAWSAANPWVRNATRARYAARKRQATPVWRDDAAINEIYKAQKAAQELFGIPVHVDHIVPLDGRRVCGIHTENNLRLMPGPENSSKGNRYWPDMWR